MSGGYPHNSDLNKIRKWDISGSESCLALAEFVCEVWNTDIGQAQLTGKRVKKLRLVTGGWSGNESIVSALHSNRMFMALCWQLDKRGGLYKYEIRLKTGRKLGKNVQTH